MTTMPDNIEIITRFELAFRAGNQAVIDELCDPGLVDHSRRPTTTHHWPDSRKR
jgi:hypothetical protein